MSEGNGNTVACRILLTGRVQGVGMRPALFRLARTYALRGHVANCDEGVEYFVCGPAETIHRVLDKLPEYVPASARLDAVRAQYVCLPAPLPGDFRIKGSVRASAAATFVVPDRATCAQCREEVNTPEERRYGYPFASCTECGPRYTAILELPYERERTTFKSFVMCEGCSAEYARAEDRRFHAQTIACERCGPHVVAIATTRHGIERAAGGRAVTLAVQALRSGQIVALKGIGGYQLLVDATDEEAVQRLRERKARRAKPFAVLVADLAQAHCLAHLEAEDRAALESPANPIVLVTAREESGLAAGVHPGLKRVGILLPTMPLHEWLVRGAGVPLVCTSGNREGEPLAHDERQAERQLRGLADVFLHHNRPIAHPVDDSVVQTTPWGRMTLRCARGLAPVPLDMGSLPRRPMLAVGGHIKSALAWHNGRQAVLGPYLGDLDHVATRDRFVAHVDSMKALYGLDDVEWIADGHSGYFATDWAALRADYLFRVQHHHAHIVTSMLERGWLDREVLGLSWDGTGFGTDRTIWGSEGLRATSRGFRRVASLRPFRLPGGDSAIRQPWRTAVGLVRELNALDMWRQMNIAGIDHRRLELVASLSRQPAFSPVTTSMGRLFDAAAALILDTVESRYEGEAACRLEQAALEDEATCYPFPLTWEPSSRRYELDWRPLVQALLSDRRAGVAPACMAARFHRAVAEAGVAVAQLAPSLPVALGGGVFQNRRLLQLLGNRLDRLGRAWCVSLQLPCNDGGLAAGQLAIALSRVRG